jgi:predicted dienelactone hydrolase
VSTTTVALYYPTLAARRAIAMGPYSLDVAIGAKPVEKGKGLILLSHGIGGSELGHSVLAQALARNGYLVAALRHPGDNWQDRSLIEKSPERYFDERPRQASRVIDAILADPAWKDRIATDSSGPRVGALGHSAGGYTVLALAGAQPDLSRVRKHCQAEASEDPIFCGIARSDVAMAPSPASHPGVGIVGMPIWLCQIRRRSACERLWWERFGLSQWSRTQTQRSRKRRSLIQTARPP